MHKVLVNYLFKLAQEKRVVRLTDHPGMTIDVDLGCKATKQAKKKLNLLSFNILASLCMHAGLKPKEQVFS